MSTYKKKTVDGRKVNGGKRVNGGRIPLNPEDRASVPIIALLKEERVKELGGKYNAGKIARQIMRNTPLSTLQILVQQKP